MPALLIFLAASVVVGLSVWLVIIQFRIKDAAGT
jgi:hypothetical protein